MHEVVKRVIIIGPAYPYRGGPARFNENLCDAFIQQGVEAEIVSFTLQYPSLLFPGTTQFENAGDKKFAFKITRLVNTINPLSWIKTAHYINKQKPDAVIFRYWLPFFAPAFGSIARMIHRNTVVLALTDNVIPHEKRMGDTFLNRYFIKACDGFICMSDKVMKDLENFTNSPNKILVHHPLYGNYLPGISRKEARKILDLPKQEKILLFFGLVRAYKGLDILLDALADKSIADRQFKLLIAGEFYEDKEKYIQKIETNGLKDKVILHDWFIPDEKVHLYFSACDAVIQPYKSATNSGVSMVSYFYDKPIISTNAGGLNEIIKDGETGWLCSPNPEDLAKSILKFLNTEDLTMFEQNIRLFKKEFSWEKFVMQIKSLIERIQNE